jgi:hypothetical protein
MSPIHASDARSGPTRRELEAKIARKAWADEAFRAEFLADPAAAFVKHAGVPAAQLPRITVHEEQPGSWHIVLPAKPDAAAELSDGELEKIAGGTTPVAIALAGVGAGMAISASAAVTTGADQGW